MLAATRRSHQISLRSTLMMCTIYVKIQAVSSLEGSLQITQGFAQNKTYVVCLLTSHFLYLQVLAHVLIGKGVIIN